MPSLTVSIFQKGNQMRETGHLVLGTSQWGENSDQNVRQLGKPPLSALHTTKPQLLPFFHFHRVGPMGPGWGEEQSEESQGGGRDSSTCCCRLSNAGRRERPLPLPPHPHSPHPLSSHCLSAAIFKARAVSRIAFFSPLPLSPGQEDTEDHLFLSNLLPRDA